MRLIDADTLRLEEIWVQSKSEYAILSHRWEDDEVIIRGHSVVLQYRHLRWEEWTSGEDFAFDYYQHKVLVLLLLAKQVILFRAWHVNPKILHNHWPSIWDATNLLLTIINS